MAAPGGYTQASRYGDLLFISGQIGNDPRTGSFEDASIDVQTQRAMDNIRAILESNHLTMANIVSVTIYLSSLSNLAAMDRAYQSYFRQSLPARSVVEVEQVAARCAGRDIGDRGPLNRKVGKQSRYNAVHALPKGGHK